MNVQSVSCGQGPIRRQHTESESLCTARCDTEGRLVYHHLSGPVTACCCLTFTDVTRVRTCIHTRTHTHAHLHGTLHPSSRGALAHNVKAENSLAHNHINRKCNKALTNGLHSTIKGSALTSPEVTGPCSRTQAHIITQGFTHTQIGHHHADKHKMLIFRTFSDTSVCFCMFGLYHLFLIDMTSQMCPIVVVFFPLLYLKVSARILNTASEKNVGIFRKKRRKEKFLCCRVNVCGNKEALVFALSQFAGSLLGLFVLGYK